MRVAVFVRGREAAPANLRKASQIAKRLNSLPARTEVATFVASALPFAALLSRDLDVVYVVTDEPSDVSTLYALKAKIIWDMSAVDVSHVPDDAADETARAAFRRAVACAQSFVNVAVGVAEAIEDRFCVGVTSHSVERAIAAVTTRVAAVVGEGLGNMIYATPMVKWLASRYGAPVDLVIHNRFDEAVHLFAQCPDLNAVYPGYEWLVGRSYDVVVSSPTAGGTAPMFRIKEHVAANRLASFNEEGRFISEPDLNFLFLPSETRDEGWLETDAARPFIRNVEYTHPNGNIVAIANGVKEGAWSKREWPFMPELVQRLREAGFVVRSFGLPGEHVAGSEDFTGIPMRDVIAELGKCSYFVGHDGGLCHIAEAIGVPTLWIFGPTGIIKNGPVYAHSDAVTARVDCGPCLYKPDWRRCSVSACMTAVSVDEVWASFEAMRQRLAENGYDLALRPLDLDLLDYELGALERPGSVGEEPVYRRERLAIFGGLSTPVVAVAAALLAGGDIQGACELTAAARHAHPEEPALRLLNAVAELAWIGGRAEAAVEETPAEVLEKAFRSLLAANLPAGDVLSLTRIVSRYALASPEGYKSALAVVTAAENALSAALPQVRTITARLASFASGLLPESERGRQQWLSLTKEEAVAWRNALRHDGPAAWLVQPTTDPAASSPWDGVEASLPARVNAIGSNVRFSFGRHSVELAPLAPVMILVPHFKFKDATAGSLSNLVARHAQGLADLGLRPVVVTVGFQDVKEGVLFRDNLLLVQAHPQWKEAHWLDVLERVKPRLVLSYAAIDALLELPDLGGAPMLRVAVDGLMDCDGAFYVLGDADKSDMREGAWFAKEHAPDACCDDLTFALFGGEIERPSNLRKKAALVLLGNSQNFKLLQHIARATPDWSFTVLTNLVHRGIEKNIHPIAQAEFNASGGSFDILVQMGSRPSNLCAEAMSFLELGDTVIAPQSPSLEPPPSGLRPVKSPDRASSWVSVLRELRPIVGTAPAEKELLSAEVG
nr:glycosyltransferase family 9 protein [Methylosinus sp. Sm6]